MNGYRTESQFVSAMVVVNVPGVNLEKFANIELSQKEFGVEKNAASSVASPVASFIQKHSNEFNSSLWDWLGVFPNNIVNQTSLLSCKQLSKSGN